jgi:hypothetical protein
MMDDVGVVECVGYGVVLFRLTGVVGAPLRSVKQLGLGGSVLAAP